MNHSSIGEIFHIEPQGGGTSPGDTRPGTVPARRLHKRRNQKQFSFHVYVSSSVISSVNAKTYQWVSMRAVSVVTFWNFLVSFVFFWKVCYF